MSTLTIIFGVELDGCLPGRDVGVGAARVGPNGLLDLLEKRLGLSFPRPSHAARVLAARDVLAARYASGAGHGRDSFGVDPLAVAARLLDWRDDLVMSGAGPGSLAGAASERLTLLAHLDAALPAVCRCAAGDRLLAILDAIAQRGVPAMTVVCVERRAHVPELWRRVLETLGATFDESTLEPTAPANSDIGRFQRIVSGGGTACEFRGDGSVVWWTAHSDMTLARRVADWVREHPDSLLLSGGEARLVDDALEDAGLARAGFPSVSAARAVPQVLRLALRLRWAPLDPQHLLDFLGHPVCPVTWELRRRLVDALLESPGIGGRRWTQAVAAARETLVGKDDEQRLNQDLADWIDVERFDGRTAVAGSGLAETCGRVARWAAARAGVASEGEASLFRRLASTAGEAGELLRGTASVTQAQLDRLLDEVLGAGTGDESREAELGHPRFARQPGAALDAAPTVIWWDAIEPSGVVASPWTGAEEKELAACGVCPMTGATLAERQSRHLLRGLMAATERVIFVQPAQRGGEALGRHPLLDHLRSVTPQGAVRALDLDKVLGDVESVPEFAVRTVAFRDLPRVRRWWRLAEAGTLLRRECESFSSLERFLYSPYQWVFQTQARLQAGRLGTRRIAADPRLFGNLMHRLVEDFVKDFAPGDSQWADPVRIGTWFEARWPVLLREEGSVLLLPVHASDCAQLKQRAERALKDLAQRFQRWGVTAIETNVKPDTAEFVGGRISGEVDLVLVLGSGRVAVLDLKYGGRKDKERQVGAGSPLQLAAYARLLSAQRQVAGGAFYILCGGHLLTRNTDVFPDAQPMSKVSGPADLAEVWREFEAVWTWRRGQLDAGWIEMTVAGTDPADVPEGLTEPLPLEHWAGPEKADTYNDFSTLTGFPADA